MPARNQPKSRNNKKPKSRARSESASPSPQPINKRKSANEQQKEVNDEFNEIVADVLSDVNGSVTVGQVRQTASLMHRHFKFFKSAFLLLIDKILVIEEKEKLMKGVYNLVSKFMHELSRNQQLNQVEINSLITSMLDQLINTYFLPKCPFQVQSRVAFLITELTFQYGIQRVKMDTELKLSLQDFIIDLFNSQRSSMQIYGVQIATHLINQQNMNDQLYMHLMKMMTHNSFRDVRRNIVSLLKTPYSEVSLFFLGKRLRDKDDDIRRITYQKLTKSGCKLDSFPSKEQRMLIIKEGLTDPSEPVRLACIEFLRASMDSEENLSVLFKLIDCKKMFVKEYYIQLPFIIMRFVFHCAGEEDTKVARYLEKLLMKLKIRSGLDESDDIDSSVDEITFEEILFLRIAFEFTKMYRTDRSQDYLDYLDKLQLNYDDYYCIFNYLLNYNQTNPTLHSDDIPSTCPNRLIFSEWVKFSLQIAIEEEVTRRNLVSLMFNYIAQVRHSFVDYQHLLKNKRLMIKEQPLNDDLGTSNGNNPKKILDCLSEDDDESDDEMPEDDNENQQNDQEQVIEIEIREFRDLEQKRDILEYCKPFSFESLVIDSDDVCRIAVIVARKLLDARIDEFSLSMLQAISDVKEPLEESEDSEIVSYKKQKDHLMKKLEEKLDQINEFVSSDDFNPAELNKVMRKVKRYVALVEEINLKEKLSFKRALNLCLILLKQCRADVNDQNLISICETLIGPTIQSKDKDNMLLAIECIGLLCLLDKELFQNYSKIFQSILTEDVLQDNLREKIIALRSSVDSLIIHGVEPKTQRLQRIIIEDYMVIKDKVLRQITIEGICKMLFSRKLTVDADQNEMEFLLSMLIIQWFDKKFNWQNSLVRQILNIFFKSFVLFSQTRCEIMMRALTKVVYSILTSKYEDALNAKNRKQKDIKKGQGGRRASSTSNPRRKKAPYEDESSYDVDDDDSFISDDSRCHLSQAYLEKICSQLDPVQITKVFMLLLSKEYVNNNAAKEFKLNKDLNTQFLLTLAYLNYSTFKKVSIVKEFIAPIVDYVNLGICEDLPQLKSLSHYIDLNCKMLIQGHPKLRRFKDSIDKRIETLQREDHEFVQLLEEGNMNKNEEAIVEGLKRQVESLEKYYEDEIVGTLIDLVKDDDEEYQELNSLQLQGLERILQSPYQQIKGQLNGTLQQQSQPTMNLRRRKSGLRSSQKKHVNSVQDNGKKLRSIPELEGEQRDISSSEKPRINFKLMNETIMEESSLNDDHSYLRDDDDSDQDDEDMSVDEEEKWERGTQNGPGNNLDFLSSNYNGKKNLQSLIEERQKRRGLMSKLSKKMAQDFKKSKKSSGSYSNQSSYSQIKENTTKEERINSTVFKITKNRLSALSNEKQDQRDDHQNTLIQGKSLIQPRGKAKVKKSNSSSVNEDSYEEPITHNLSMRFDELHSNEKKALAKSNLDTSNNSGHLLVSAIKKDLKRGPVKNKSKAALNGSMNSSRVFEKSDDKENNKILGNKGGINRSFQSANVIISDSLSGSLMVSSAKAGGGIVNRSYEARNHLFVPGKDLRMTRQRMKSISSQNGSKASQGSLEDSDSSSSDGSESSSNALDFMTSNLSKQRKPQAKKPAQQQKNAIKFQQQSPNNANGLNMINKRVRKDLEDEDHKNDVSFDKKGKSKRAQQSKPSGKMNGSFDTMSNGSMASSRAQRAAARK